MYFLYLDYRSDFSLIFRLGCLVRKDRTRLYFSFQFVVPHIILCYTLDTLIELHMWYLHYPPLNYITCFLFSAFQLLLDQGIMKLSLPPIHMHRFVQFNISLCYITPQFIFQEMRFWDIQLACYGLSFLLLSISLKLLAGSRKKDIKAGSRMKLWSLYPDSFTFNIQLVVLSYV